MIPALLSRKSRRQIAREAARDALGIAEWLISPPVSPAQREVVRTFQLVTCVCAGMLWGLLT